MEARTLLAGFLVVGLLFFLIFDDQFSNGRRFSYPQVDPNQSLRSEKGFSSTNPHEKEVRTNGGEAEGSNPNPERDTSQPRKRIVSKQGDKPGSAPSTTSEGGLAYGGDSNTREASNTRPMALNFMDSKLYPHHPIFSTVKVQPYPIKEGYIVELNGLYVPAGFDCRMFHKADNPDRPWWGGHDYYTEVPTRWHNCHLLEAAKKSGLKWMTPELPFVDDEYMETAATYQSVLRSDPSKPFIVAEFGARWGTWGARAIQYMRQVHPDQDYKVFFNEMNKLHCDGIKQVMEVNDMKNYEISCQPGGAGVLHSFLSNVNHMDLIDLDVQGAEWDVISGGIKAMNEKVKRVTIATHGQDIHSKCKAHMTANGWILIEEVAHSTDLGLTQRYHRGTDKKHPEKKWNWEEMYSLNNPGIYQETPFGPFMQADGELIFDNPKFVDKEKIMTMDDTVLKIDDLKK